MYCLGTPSATAMAPLISLVKEKKQENPKRPIHQITAWRFYKPEKKVLKKSHHTFISYVILCELEVAKLKDAKYTNAKSNSKYAQDLMFKKKHLQLTAKEENGTPTGIIMREYIAYLVEKGFTLEGNQTMWGRFSCGEIKSMRKNGPLILQKKVRADLEEAMKQRAAEYKNLLINK